MITATPSVMASAVETDPTGKTQHEAGAKLDAGKNRLALVLGGFAPALLEVGKVGTYGAAKYTPNGWKSVPDPVDRYMDAAYRHLMDYAMGDKVNHQDGEVLHLAQAAWNILAALSMELEQAKTQQGQ